MRDILVPSGESFPGQCCAFTRCHLETIVAHALAWEEKLFQERHGAERQAASA